MVNTTIPILFCKWMVQVANSSEFNKTKNMNAYYKNY